MRPDDVQFQKSHEWVKIEGDTATIGITDHAQQELTDIVFVELPEVGQQLTAKDQCAVVESVKTASDIYSPVSGEIIEVNSALEEDPSLVNTAPYEGGHFFKIRLSDPAEADGLLSAGSYQSQIGE